MPECLSGFAIMRYINPRYLIVHGLRCGKHRKLVNTMVKNKKNQPKRIFRQTYVASKSQAHGRMRLFMFTVHTAKQFTI